MINKTDLIFMQSKSGIKPFSVVDKPAKSKNIRDVIPYPRSPKNASF